MTETNDLAKKAFDAIKELTSTGFFQVHVEWDRHEKLKTKLWLDEETCMAKLNIVMDAPWEEVAEHIAKAYTLVDQARKLYSYKTANPNPTKALYEMINHKSNKL